MIYKVLGIVALVLALLLATGLVPVSTNAQDVLGSQPDLASAVDAAQALPAGDNLNWPMAAAVGSVIFGFGLLLRRDMR